VLPRCFNVYVNGLSAHAGAAGALKINGLSGNAPYT
jgi:hypothetical protein